VEQPQALNSQALASSNRAPPGPYAKSPGPAWGVPQEALRTGRSSSSRSCELPAGPIMSCCCKQGWASMGRGNLAHHLGQSGLSVPISGLARLSWWYIREAVGSRVASDLRSLPFSPHPATLPCFCPLRAPPAFSQDDVQDPPRPGCGPGCLCPLRPHLPPVACRHPRPP
jgi:hypothetical protein